MGVVNMCWIAGLHQPFLFNKGISQCSSILGGAVQLFVTVVGHSSRIFCVWCVARSMDIRGSSVDSSQWFVYLLSRKQTSVAPIPDVLSGKSHSHHAFVTVGVLN